MSEPPFQPARASTDTTLVVLSVLIPGPPRDDHSSQKDSSTQPAEVTKDRILEQIKSILVRTADELEGHASESADGSGGRGPGQSIPHQAKQLRQAASDVQITISARPAKGAWHKPQRTNVWLYFPGRELRNVVWDNLRYILHKPLGPIKDTPHTIMPWLPNHQKTILFSRAMIYVRDLPGSATAKQLHDMCSTIEYEPDRLIGDRVYSCRVHPTKDGTVSGSILVAGADIATFLITRLDGAQLRDHDRKLKLERYQPQTIRLAKQIAEIGWESLYISGLDREYDEAELRTHLEAVSNDTLEKFKMLRVDRTNSDSAFNGTVLIKLSSALGGTQLRDRIQKGMAGETEAFGELRFQVPSAAGVSQFTPKAQRKRLGRSSKLTERVRELAPDHPVFTSQKKHIAGCVNLELRNMPSETTIHMMLDVLMAIEHIAQSVSRDVLAGRISIRKNPRSQHVRVWIILPDALAELIRARFHCTPLNRILGREHEGRSGVLVEARILLPPEERIKRTLIKILQSPDDAPDHSEGLRDQAVPGLRDLPPGSQLSGVGHGHGRGAHGGHIHAMAPHVGHRPAPHGPGGYVPMSAQHGGFQHSGVSPGGHAHAPSAGSYPVGGQPGHYAGGYQQAPPMPPQHHMQRQGQSHYPRPLPVPQQAGEFGHHARPQGVPAPGAGTAFVPFVRPGQPPADMHSDGAESYIH